MHGFCILTNKQRIRIGMETDQRRVGQDVMRHLGEHWGTFYFH